MTWGLSWDGTRGGGHVSEQTVPMLAGAGPPVGLRVHAHRGAECGRTLPLDASPVLGVSLCHAPLRGLWQSPAQVVLELSPWRAEKGTGHLRIFISLEGTCGMLGPAWVSFKG